MSKRNVKRRFITLLELLIVLGLLAVIGSLTAFNVNKMYQEQQALNEMSRVVQMLNRATDLMMLVNLDAEIRFSKKGDHFEVELIPKSSLSPLTQPLLTNKPLVLERINHIAFKDGIQDTVLTDNFSLVFLSKGFLMNRGVITLQTPSLTGSILLYGYPAPVELTKGVIAYPDDKPFVDLIQKLTEQTRLET